jgi:rSAM/selenodomain-associated transferase 1
MMREALCVMMKYPVAGGVKTRLAAETGNEKAAAVYAEMCGNILKEAKKTGRDVFVFVAPEEAVTEAFSMFGTKASYLPQSDGDLGERMYRAISYVFLQNYDHVILTGTDIPELSCSLFEDAFTNLCEYPAVAGPSADGGYYLIGFRKETLHPAVFSNIEWSTDKVLAETLRKLDMFGLNCGKLKEIQDVDTFEDLKLYLSRNTEDPLALRIRTILSEG